MFLMVFFQPRFEGLLYLFRVENCIAFHTFAINPLVQVGVDLNLQLVVGYLSEAPIEEEKPFDSLCPIRGDFTGILRLNGLPLQDWEKRQ